MSSDGADLYTGDNVKVVRGPQWVRRNPAMFVGNCGPSGLAFMVDELVVAALESQARVVRVEFRADGSVRIEDDGRIGVRTDPSAVEGWLSWSPRRPDPGRWFEYAYASALSEWFCVEWRDGGRPHQLAFRQGAPAPAPDDAPVPAGLAVTFRPDPEIFDGARLTAADARDHLQAHALLRSGVRLTLVDEAGRAEVFERRTASGTTSPCSTRTRPACTRS